MDSNVGIENVKKKNQNVYASKVKTNIEVTLTHYPIPSPQRTHTHIYMQMWITFYPHTHTEKLSEFWLLFEHLRVYALANKIDLKYTKKTIQFKKWKQMSLREKQMKEKIIGLCLLLAYLN